MVENCKIDIRVCSSQIKGGGGGGGSAPSAPPPFLRTRAYVYTRAGELHVRAHRIGAEGELGAS